MFARFVHEARTRQHAQMRVYMECMKLLDSAIASMPNPGMPDFPGNPEPAEMPSTTGLPDMPNIETPIDPGYMPDDPGSEPSSMPSIE